MIKAVFFDMFNTLSYFHPPREQRQAIAWQKFGIHVPLEGIRRAYVVGEQCWTTENARWPLAKRTPEEMRSFLAEYEKCLLEAAGETVSSELAYQIYTTYWDQDRTLVLFDDVVPTLTTLRRRGIIIGMLTNVDRDVAPFCEDLGIAPYFQFLLSSCQVGVEKPHAHIFQTALQKAEVSPGEAIHVGDQYHSDIIGARAVGILPLLIDRDGLMNGQFDCQRIKRLDEVLDYLRPH